jgi:predicted nucleic acid-binding protein
LKVAGVADTHKAIWRLFENARLSAAVATFITEAANARQKIAISSITQAELIYSVEKSRLPQLAYDELTKALADPEHVFAEAVFTAAILKSMRRISRAEVLGLPDRIIAATAAYSMFPSSAATGKPFQPDFAEFGKFGTFDIGLSECGHRAGRGRGRRCGSVGGSFRAW